jgi:hypothetical protein
MKLNIYKFDQGEYEDYIWIYAQSEEKATNLYRDYIKGNTDNTIVSILPEKDWHKHGITYESSDDSWSESFFEIMKTVKDTCGIFESQAGYQVS